MASSDYDASKDGARNQSSASGQEAGTKEEESTPEMEKVTQKKGKKRRREEKEGQKKKAAPTAATSERPLRERKSVVRYTATESRSVPATKALKIQQGPGVMLKDIPNVFFKLSKRKSDESLPVLHKILFGRKANVHFLKRNILQFSGFVWSQNEEKERSKVKEKLNKCNKDRLLDFCDMLDVYTLKVTTKKEEISAKLLEFLESPHVTREVILSEKATKGKKRRRGVKGTEEKPVEEVSSDKENTRPKKDKEAKKPRKKSADGYKVDQHKIGDSIDINDESEDKRDDAEETTEHSNSEAEDEDNEDEDNEDEDNEDEDPESTKTLSDGEDVDEHEEPKSKVKPPAVRKVFRTKSKKGSSSSATQKPDPEDETKVSSESKRSKGSKGGSKTEKKKSSSKNDSKVNSSRKAPQRKVETDSGSRASSHRSKKVKEEGKSNVRAASKDKKQVAKAASKDSKESKKQNVKTVSKDVKESKKQTKAKSRTGAKKKGKREDVFDEPSTEQLYAVVSEILKEVDFNVATLADIIRQLGAHFNTDLMHRKTEIKGILEEVINNMTDDEDEEEDGPEE